MGVGCIDIIFYFSQLHLYILDIFWAAASLLLCSFKNVFLYLRIRIRRRNGDCFTSARRAPKLHYYGDVIHSFYWKSAVEHDGGV